jgi:hypothetical protein
LYATEKFEFEGARFQASSAVLLGPSFFWDVMLRSLAFFLACLTLEDGIDRLSRNFGDQMPTYVA